jgi:hypothetical protein
MAAALQSFEIHHSTLLRLINDELEKKQSVIVAYLKYNIDIRLQGQRKTMEHFIMDNWSPT